jgi:mannose-6-phosphate isomerase
LNTNELINCALTPLGQNSNRVWRTYQGGSLIDRWKKTKPEKDGNMPEEWIMSTISARGKNRPSEEGLSFVSTPSGILQLKELIEADSELFLGKRVATRFGATGVLIKMLDARERLTIQVHPDKDYAREMFNSAFGKTESWYILGGRETEDEKSCIYLGFKEGITEDRWSKLFYRQDINGMLSCLHHFPVNSGDAFIIYGGVPHAIGNGCFLMEVQEPTDYTMRVEKITPGGLTISDELIHQGVGEEKMLKCFHYDGCSFEEAEKRWKVAPKLLESSGAYTLKSIFNELHTDCFALKELLLDGEMTLHGNGDFFVGVIYSGEGTMTCGGKEYSFVQGDEIFFSAAIESVKLNSRVVSKILLCYPPI